MIPGVTFHPRASWQDPRKPITGPAPIPNRLDTFAIHYTAADNLIDGDPGETADQLDDYLRQIQASYLTARGYSIGYNFAVDWLGGVWELRGYDIRCAANKGWNERTIAVLCLVDGQDPMTVEAVRSVNAVYAESERRYRPLQLKGHRDIGATACPGVGIYSQIRAGLIRPQARPPVEPIAPIPPPTDEDDDMSHAIRWAHARQPGQFLINGGVTRVTPELAKVYADIPLVREDDDAMLKACLHATGLNVEDLA